MASAINKVILIGNLGRDPEVRETGNGVKVASINLATTLTYYDKEANERKEITDWHRIVLWRGLAELAEKYLRKGSKVYVEGRLSTRSYEQNGEMRYITEVIGSDIVLLGGRVEGVGNGNEVMQNDEEMNNIPRSSIPKPVTNNIEADNSTDDLPF
ncbi:MAG: single-stranded DNA-binding protein [Cytophagales bacterium]|nr:MAG: single-stranded DNA-binding protein [Cytophagales bacterium]TAF60469.1 MAG: single-stranded DNA-binding protein [Cytophagales bacterium]